MITASSNIYFDNAKIIYVKDLLQFAGTLLMYKRFYFSSIFEYFVLNNLKNISPLKIVINVPSR